MDFSWDFQWILRALLDPSMKCLYIFRRILCWIFKIFTKNPSENSGGNTIMVAIAQNPLKI